MVGASAVGAAVCYLLLGLVAGEASLGVVLSTANSADRVPAAGCLVVAKLVTAVASQGFGDEGAEVERSPVA